MPAEAEDMQPSRASPASGAPEALARAAEQECYGPLLLARYVKEDGRALILYSGSAVDPREPDE